MYKGSDPCTLSAHNGANPKHIRPPTPMYLGVMYLLCIENILIISLCTTTLSLTITDHQLERDLALSILSPSSSSSPLTMWRRQIWSPFFPYYGLLWLYICAYVYDCKQWNMSSESKAVILLQTFPLHRCTKTIKISWRPEHQQWNE
jgi:hypothetical protein